MIIFIAGLILIGVLANYLYRINLLVKRRTSELQRINEELKLEIIERNIASEFNEILVKTIPFGMDIVDENGCILYIDEKIKKFLGIKETAGKKCFTLYKDNKEQCRDCPLRNGIEIGKTDVVEVEGVLGGRIYRVTHTGMMYKGKKALLEVFEDITERKEIENQLRKLSSAVEHSPSIIMVTNAEGYFEYVNPKFTQITGYSLEELKGKTPSILKSGEKVDGEYERLWEVITAGGEWRGEFHNKKKNGEFYWESASISSIKDAKGRIINYIKVGEDITERKRLEEMKDEFVSTVSHELRTPLSIIREGVSQTVDEIHGGITEKQRQILAISLRNIDRLGRIIEDLLNISKIESGRVELSKEIVDLVDLAKKVVFTFRSSIEKKGLELKEEYPSERVEANIDRDKIIQVFTNLIDDAVKFTEKGYIEVSIVDKEDVAECSITDTGIGIAEENLLRTFSKFVQFGRTAGPGGKGTGLGLAISKGIIEMHRGRIWVESKLGAGSRFTFTLPKRG